MKVYCTGPADSQNRTYNLLQHQFCIFYTTHALIYPLITLLISSPLAYMFPESHLYT